MDKPLENGADHLELDQVNGLIAAAGVDGTREILDAFWRSTEELLDALSAQVGDGALALAAQTAHAIKGSAANVGASRLAKTAAQLEIACKAENADAAPVLMRDTRAHFEAAKNRLTEHLLKSA